MVQAELAGEPVLARRHLEVCVFSHVAAELKTGDLCVEGSEKYADYREQLLSWEECEPLVEEHCRELGLEPTPEGFVGQLKDLLSGTAREVDRSYPENSSVVITEDDGEPVLKKTPKRISSRAVKSLEAAVAERMPERNLTDVVCAAEHWTGWTSQLGPLSGSEPKLANARERYVLTAFGYGTNMGPVQTARHTRGLVTAHELGYVNRRHVSTSKLEAAIADVVNAYSNLDLPRVWGTGDTAAADGTKIDLRENNLTSEYHVRYGGYGGIAYHHVSDTYVALFTHFIACGVWEAVYIIDGLLKNASEIQPKAVASDTQGQSAPVFGLAHLLGVGLMPRIRNWKGLILFRPDKDTAYEHTDALFGDAIDWKLVETHWKDLMRVVISVRAGKVLPSTLLRKLGNYSRKNRLYRAFREVGRVAKSLSLLSYVGDAAHRRRILVQLNRHEKRHELSRKVFHGQRGEVRKRYREGQEDQLGALGLVVNAVCLFNSLYLDEAIRRLRDHGEEVTDEDLARVSPLAREHVRVLGRYHFALDESVAGGGLRPLRDPSEPDEYEFSPESLGEPSP